MKTVGDYIFTARQKKGMTQRELAYKAFIDPCIMAQYEGDKRKPTMTTITRIVAALEITIDQLLEDTNDI